MCPGDRTGTYENRRVLHRLFAWIKTHSRRGSLLPAVPPAFIPSDRKVLHACHNPTMAQSLPTSHPALWNRWRSFSIKLIRTI
jgi:hypothetical protein